MPRKGKRKSVKNEPLVEAGNVYGRLTVIELDKTNPRSRTRWKCVCSCGNERVVKGGELRNRDVGSCGCWQKEARVTNNTTHGDHGTYLHRIWCKIRERTKNPNCHTFKYYGGRGIFLSEEFHDFSTFKRHLVDDVGYNEGHVRENRLQLDRIDNNKGYERGNLRFVTAKENCNNRRIAQPRKKNTIYD